VIISHVYPTNLQDEVEAAAKDAAMKDQSHAPPSKAAAAAAQKAAAAALFEVGWCSPYVLRFSGRRRVAYGIQHRHLMIDVMLSSLLSLQHLEAHATFPC
jgi:hypothetical protein